MPVTLQYQPGFDSKYTGILGSGQVLQSGIFLCSVPYSSGYNAAANGTNGVILAYGQSKEIALIDDSAAVVYVGRAKPSAETGIYLFNSYTLSYRVPPASANLYGTQVDPGSGNDVETALRAIVAAEHSNSLACLQDARRGTRLYGMLANVRFSHLIDPALWTEVSAVFYEVGG